MEQELNQGILDRTAKIAKFVEELAAKEGDMYAGMIASLFSLTNCFMILSKDLPDQDKFEQLVDDFVAPAMQNLTNNYSLSYCAATVIGFKACSKEDATKVHQETLLKMTAHMDTMMKMQAPSPSENLASTLPEIVSKQLH